MAYRLCRKHKGRKASSIVYDMNYEQNNYNLWRELNDGTYEIGKSIAFCVTRPKLREVFAASFRDRVVHHLLIDKMLPIFESDFIRDTYNCRVGKGVLYGVHRVQEQARAIGGDCWFLKVDISGFFMSIDKDILWRSVEKLIREKWTHGNVDRWLDLLKKVIFHRPERLCVRRGNPRLFDALPKNKSLFWSDGKGLPIGNLTSQILANHYMSAIDKSFSPIVGGYGRYVDDIILMDSDRRRLIRMLPRIRKELADIALTLHERKIVFQRADKGVPFTGYVIQPWGLYAASRLACNARKAARRIEDADTHLMRINSYLGFLQHALTYGMRFKIWLDTLRRYAGQRIYATEHLNSIHIFKNKKR